MLETGFLAGLIAKLAGLGSAAKVAIAGTTAALTLTVAGGAAGVLPLPGGSAGDAAIQATAPGAVVVETTTPTTSADTAAPDTGASVTAVTGSTSASADAAADVSPPTASVATPAVPAAVPAGALPDLSGLAQIPTQVMNCLTPVLDLVTGLPTVSPSQIHQVGTSIVGCVTGIVRSVPLPFGLDACIAQIMGFVGDLSSQLPTGTPDLSGFDVAACIPSGLPVPTGASGWMGFFGGGFPFGR